MQADGPSSCVAGHIQQRQAGPLVPVHVLSAIQTTLIDCSYWDRRDRLYYLSQTTGSDGVSFLLPQLFFSQHRLQQGNDLSRDDRNDRSDKMCQGMPRCVMGDHGVSWDAKGDVMCHGRKRSVPGCRTIWGNKWC